MEFLGGLVFILLVYGAVFVMSSIHEDIQEFLENRRLRKLLGGAFHEIRREPELLVEKPKDALEVSLDRVPYIRGGYMNKRTLFRWNSYLKTSLGPILLQSRDDKDDKADIRSNARWLAKKWGIPFREND